jgi:hypothetical protein
VPVSEALTISTLPVGDPRRVPLGRAMLRTLAAAVVFVAFALASKELDVLYRHVPWSDDPYDAAVSFAIFFVPLMIAVDLVRVLRCRRDEPLPMARVRSVVRGGRVMLAATLITLTGDWISLVLQTNRASWTGITAAVAAVLVVVSAIALKAAFDLHRAASPLPVISREESYDPDWFTDAVALGDRYSAWLGPLAHVARRRIDWVDRHVIAAIRTYPIVAGAVSALAFGVLLALNQLVREGPGAALWIDVVVGSSGMFAFLTAGATYVGVVRSERPPAGPRRRMIDAAVAGCAAAPTALALRSGLGWVIGSGVDTPGRVGVLIAVASVVTVAVVFGGETVLHIHPRAGA